MYTQLLNRVREITNRQGDSVTQVHERAVARLVAAYPRMTFGRQTVAAYVWGLEDLPEKVVREVVDLAIRRNAFPPAISELRRLAAERQLGYPTTSVALELVERYVTEGPLVGCRRCHGSGVLGEGVDCGTCDGTGEVTNRKRPQLPEPAQRALKVIGGPFAWKTTDNVRVLHAQFRQHYEEFSEATVRQLIDGNPGAELEAQKELTV